MVLPSRPAAAGPFTRSIREALESAVTPAAAANVLADALKRASLTSVPEEIEPFRRFCEGAFRTSVHAAMGEHAVEQVFERLGHVLWMATSDVQALETARAWSRGTGMSARDDQGSGVRHVEPDPRRPLEATATPRPKDESGPNLKRPAAPTPPPMSPPLLDATSVPRASASETAVTLGRMRAPTLQGAPSATGSRPGAGVTGSRPGASPTSSRPGRTMETGPGQTADRRVSSSPPPGPGPLPSTPTPVRQDAATAGTSSPRSAPTAVLVVTLDVHLVSDIREELAGQCPVRSVGAPAELAASLATAGPRPVIVVDTALPSIDVPTFAGLAPILPAGARVVLWGAAPRQQQRLATLFPLATGWIASGQAPRAGRFVLDLP